MKNLYQNHVRTLFTRCNHTLLRIQAKLKETSGQFVIDHAAVFIIIIVLAGIALTLLSNYVETDFATALKDKINALFNI